MRGFPRKCWFPAIAVLTLVLTVAVVSCRPAADGVELARLSPERLAPFTRNDIKQIANSSMHAAHLRGDARCADCHAAAQPLTATETANLCSNCHTVETENDLAWKHHCAACHPFTARLENSAGGYGALSDHCEECHRPGEAERFGSCETDANADRSCSSCHKPHTGKILSGPQQIVPFTRAELTTVLGNKMHDLHREEGADCDDCHTGNEPLSPAKAQMKCNECHAAEVVTAEVWLYHCLACHSFTKAAERAQGSIRIAQELCRNCHEGEEAGERIIAFCEKGESHNITCERCHEPHRSAEVAGEDVCAECHADIVGKMHPSKGAHGSCLMCHVPHRRRESGEQLCSRCHFPSETVLVHHIPGHPSDCTECHSPHFTETEIIGEACLNCHQGMFYAGGRNLPKEHRDCESCHFISSFRYKGDRACAGCHPEEGKVLDDESLHSQHRHCTTCHHPHIWRAPFEENCTICHDVEKVVEHNMPFHQKDCRACHEPHSTSTMARTGDCNGCHQERFTTPAFSPNAPQPHVTCENCHSEAAISSRKFFFAGPEGTCMGCHPDARAEPKLAWDEVPGGHRKCSICHHPHVFAVHPDARNCGTCHRDLYASPPTQAHAECYNCHEASHAAEFIGQEASCAVCHSLAWRRSRGLVKEDCLSCHQPHEMKADFSGCGECHADVLSQLENTMHSDCGTCHDTHRWRPDAKSCAECHSELPGLHGNRGHGDCKSCHPLHSLKAGADRCSECHAEPPATCTSQDCLSCHRFE